MVEELSTQPPYSASLITPAPDLQPSIQLQQPEPSSLMETPIKEYTEPAPAIEADMQVHDPMQANLAFEAYELPSPNKMDPIECRSTMKSSFRRILETVGTFSLYMWRQPLATHDGLAGNWMTMVARLVANEDWERGEPLESHGEESNVESDDGPRGNLAEMLLDFVLLEFKTRYELAMLWLHEEWYLYSNTAEGEGSDLKVSLADFSPFP